MITIREIKNNSWGVVNIYYEKTKNLKYPIIDIVKLDSKAIIKNLKNRALKEFKDWFNEKNIILKPMRIINKDFDKSFGLIPIFKHWPEFCLKDHSEDGVFRLHPYFNTIAINKEGLVYDLRKGKFLSPIKVQKYGLDYITVKLSDYNAVKPIHRLVAETWVSNDDYFINYVVDHIDGNKLNNSMSNLRWVSNRVNVAKHSFGNRLNLDYRYAVYNIDNGEVKKFISLKDLGDYLNMEYRTLYAKNFPFYIETSKGSIIVEDLNNFTDWSLLKDLHKYKYNFKLKTPDNKELYFKTFLDLRSYLKGKYKNLDLRYVDRIENLIKKLEGTNFKLERIGAKKVYNQFTDKFHIEAKDLKTGEIIKAPSTKLLGEKLGTNKSNIIIRLNGNKREGIPLEINGKSYLIRRSDKPFPDIKEKKNGAKKILHTPTNQIFNSLREASRVLNIPRNIITQCVNDKNCKDFTYTNIF